MQVHRLLGVGLGVGLLGVGGKNPREAEREGEKDRKRKCDREGARCVSSSVDDQPLSDLSYKAPYISGGDVPYSQCAPYYSVYSLQLCFVFL